MIRLPPEVAIPEGLAGIWWVAHTRPRNEKALSLELSVRGVFHYLPLCKRTTRSRNTGRRSRSILPVFSGYLFFNADEDERLAALSTNRIANLLAVSEPLRLLAELRSIQQVVAAGQEFDFQPRLQEGDWVQVVAGALQGLVGQVEYVRSRVKIALNVETLGQSIIVETEAANVEKIDPPVYAQR
jgi:transcriptional antiterminator RfaH